MGFTHGGFPVTTVTPGAASAKGVVETLKVMDDTVKTHELGHRASCYVTTELGRRNVEAACEDLGGNLRYGLVQGIPNEVPFYRGRPVLVCAGLSDEQDETSIYAMDLTQFFFVATSGTSESFCVEEVHLPLQKSGVIGALQFVHGAVIALTDHAMTSSTITTTLSA
jgi:hypothetical protein